jgi:hypothetical protein
MHSHQYATHPEKANPGPPSPAKATSKAPNEKVGLGRLVKLKPMLNQASPKIQAHHPGKLATGSQTGAALWILSQNAQAHVYAGQFEEDGKSNVFANPTKRRELGGCAILQC